jgi:hypothetical protein
MVTAFLFKAKESASGPPLDAAGGGGAVSPR